MDIALVFDIDGTLVDVRESYKEAIVQTILHIREGTDPDRIRAIMEDIKGISNLNNDWDGTYYILEMLEGREPAVIRNEKWKNIQKIFQSIYLGKDLYIRSYGENPPLKFKKGLIENERLLISESVLEKIKDIPKGIVTSRLRLEAEYILDKTILSKYFDKKNIIALDDVVHEKPNPEPLLKMKEKLPAKKHYYIGDTIDDAMAAKRAEYTSIIIKENWGDMTIPNINSLPNALNLSCNK